MLGFGDAVLLTEVTELLKRGGRNRFIGGHALDKGAVHKQTNFASFRLQITLHMTHHDSHPGRKKGLR